MEIVDNLNIREEDGIEDEGSGIEEEERDKIEEEREDKICILVDYIDMNRLKILEADSVSETHAETPTFVCVPKDEVEHCLIEEGLTKGDVDKFYAFMKSRELILVNESELEKYSGITICCEYDEYKLQETDIFK